jgi:hypothetical protein
LGVEPKRRPANIALLKVLAIQVHAEERGETRKGDKANEVVKCVSALKFGDGCLPSDLASSRGRASKMSPATNMLALLFQMH